MKQWVCTVGLGVVLVGLVVAIAACGGAKTASDPFVGTWRDQAANGRLGQTPMIVTKSGNGYVATFVFWGPGEEPASPRPTLFVSMRRHGDKLTGTFATGLKLRAEIVYLPNSGKATWANSRTATGPLNKPTVMVKVSLGTAYPTTL